MLSLQNVQGDLEGDVLIVGLGKDAANGVDGIDKTAIGHPVMTAIPTNHGDKEAWVLGYVSIHNTMVENRKKNTE